MVGSGKKFGFWQWKEFGVLAGFGYNGIEMEVEFRTSNRYS